MRRFPVLFPLLLLLALTGYLLPARSPQGEQAPTPPAAVTPLPQALPAEERDLFAALRPAVVRVDSVNMATRTGGLGTGFFVSGQGRVLTAYHVVKAGQLFQVTTLSGKTYPARVTAFDEAADVALLQVTRGGPFPFLELASQPPKVGERVLAIGNSGGDFLQPRRGELLRLNAEAGRSDFPAGTLEMNAPLAQGDSGGPIFNGRGEVLGVVSYVRVSGDGVTRASYAVPVPGGGELIGALQAGEKRESPLTALVGLAFDQNHSGLTDPPGAVILRVTPGSAAARAGLRGCVADRQGQLTALGDVILGIGGVRTPDSGTALDQVKRLKVGDRVEVEYLRGGQRTRTTLTLRAQPVGKTPLDAQPCTRQ
ncbi:serine protease [Deinococcus wulumuqiensis]|uniref:Serine protease n=1 Tax=Deinococcus wulumuqiensis TaxID=980427 RepID=A0A345IH77_9DEIO|nr:S1C family serine protease [Deinococcus wulumuqiensis]AXG99049.1 serine protease [Deinococcus wulumuqiensis]